MERPVGPRDAGVRRQRPDAADQRLKSTHHIVLKHSQLQRRHATVEQVGGQQFNGRRAHRSHWPDDHANSKRCRSRIDIIMCFVRLTRRLVVLIYTVNKRSFIYEFKFYDGTDRNCVPYT